MATTNSGVSVTVLLSVSCLGLAIMFVGGWYFLQSSIVELKEQQQFLQSSLLELKAQKQETAQVVQQLKEKVKKQSKQLSELHLQLGMMRLEDDDQFTEKTFNNNITSKHSVVKRSNSTLPNEKKLEICRGKDGRDGLPGPRGRDGHDGNNGSPGPRGRDGRDGQDGQDGLQGPRGRDGQDGLPGLKGVAGPPGQKGDIGVPGPKGEKAGGVVYVRWGHNSCPTSGAQLVYAGRAGGSYYGHKGGGSNPQCLPLDPQFYKAANRANYRAYMYGAEYQDTNPLVANSHNTDVPCAVCYVPTRNVLYMIPAKHDCPKDWTREYFGYLMSEHYTHHRSQFSCVDHSLTPVTGSSRNHDGFLFHAIDGVCGSLPCPPYRNDKEFTCAVCTK